MKRIITRDILTPLNLVISGTIGKVKTAFLLGTAFLTLWFLAHTIVIIWIGLKNEIQEADVAIVLGNRVDENGVPSLRLQSRLDRAVELHRQQKIRAIIVSGGRGVEGYEEAEVMRDVLFEVGIPITDIFIDKQGYDTFQTARNSKIIMKSEGFRRAVIVTQYYHIARTRLAFKRFGIEPVFSVYAEVGPELRDPYAIIREFVAFYYYLFRIYPEE